MSEEKISTRQAVFDWLDEVEDALDQIRRHAESLPSSEATGEREWDDRDGYTMAQMVVKIGAIASTSQFLYSAIMEILAEQVRSDASQN
jgi:hypothetical protein